MKNKIMVMLLLLPIVLLAQRRPKIKGNRAVTEVVQELPPFNAINLLDNLKITLNKSNEESVYILADDNLIDVLKFKVEDNVLQISSFYDITSKKKLDIIVNFKDLISVNAQSGKLESEDIISADKFTINASGDADLVLRADAFEVGVKANDNSNLELNLQVDSLFTKVKDKSKAAIFMANGTAMVKVEDTSDLILEGTSQQLQASVMGNSKLKAQKLETTTVDVAVEGNSVARVFVTNQLTLNAIGDSKTYLYGDPQITIQKFANTTQLIKKELK